LWPDSIDSNDASQPFGRDTPDAAKLPVLLVLLNDADLRVRWWASEKLARVNAEAAPRAAAALERLLRDEDPSNRFLAVMALKQLGPTARSTLPTLYGLRGDTTRVAWMGNRFDELVDQAIRSIDPDGVQNGAGRP
jgi:HEAT repeats